MSFPIIDVSQIDDPAAQLRISKEITEACSKWGFLLLRNHPIPAAEIEDAFSLGRQFFHLREDLKELWPINAKSIGYIGSFKDQRKDDKMSMWFGGGPGSLSDNKALPPFWREHTTKIEALKHKCHDLVLKLLVCFAIAMDLPDVNFFSSQHDENAGDGNSLRMIMYPARESQSGADITRMNAHTDSGTVTLLFQRQAGLEVTSPEGKWVRAPCVEDCVLVNIGDSLAFWSGAKLKATMHRVSFHSCPYDKERQTMAYFGKANPSTVLAPIVEGKEVERYVTNGIVLRSGMTVGELDRRIMDEIYGARKVA
jgi:isopenicillin N synthase-like dioxygenase